MKELVFLLEEVSARALLESLLPRVLDSAIQPRLIAFEGKQDLEKQMTRRIRHYNNPDARFIVLRDQDSTPDCMDVKARLLERCQQAGKRTTCRVRIACTELETFYIADLSAVGLALEMHGLANHQSKQKFREPDRLGNPSKELSMLTGGRYQKVSGSRVIGTHLNIDNTRSPSFKHLIAAVRHFEAELLAINELADS